MAIIDGTIADLSQNFIPEVWADWVYDRMTETNAMIRSGILKNDDKLGPQLLSRGLFITIPHVQHIDETLEPQDWNNHTDLVAHDGTSFTENDVKMTDAQVFGSSDYDEMVTGAQTLNALSAQFPDYWNHVDTQRMFQVLNATYLNADILEAKSFGVGAEKDFSASNFIKAMARMGDVAGDKPTRMAVNSGTYNYLLNQNLITFVQPSDGGKPIGNYNGMLITQDDQVPLTTDGKTCAYIYGSGAINYSIATPAHGVALVRDELHQGGISAISQKRVSTMHVAGTMADMAVESNPTKWKADLKDGTKALYAPVNDVRDIHIIKYGFTIDKDFVIPGVNTTAKPSTAASTSNTTGGK